MRPRPLLPALLLLASGLAACTEAPPAEGGDGLAPPAGLSLTGCSGFEAHLGPLPPAVAPGAAPPGWEPSAGNAPSVRMEGFACERIGLARFERPVRLVVDSHTRASIPDACHRSGLRERTGVVGTLWVDDAEVARFLAEAYGLPARPAAIEAAARPGAAGTAHEWSWGDAEGLSQMTLLDAGGGEEANVPTLLLWSRGEGRGVASLGLVYEGRTAAGHELPAFGEASAPALLAALPGGGTFAALGTWSPAFSAEGTFVLYRDGMCEDPEVGA
jgi:hypothetical protein